MPDAKPKPARKVVPLGNPLPWGPGEIDRRAQTTDEDKIAALAWWQANTYQSWRELLQAKTLRRRKAG